ncbi:hypothetical protein C8R43DRAFT_1130307 [Mycena crocata]|nr:hypothetical protein C8R43DRAFT_1130307 [Mycena crocata]
MSSRVSTRSSIAFSFKDQPYGEVIQATRPTDYRLALVDELYRTMNRENDDRVYRGEIKPHESCVPAYLPVTRNLTPTEPAGSERALTPTEPASSVRTLSPADSTCEPPTEPSSSPPPASSSERDGSPVATSSSSRELDAVSSRYPTGRTPSPTATDLMNLPPPRKMITYARRHRQRIHDNNAAKAASSKGSKQAASTKARVKRARKVYPARSRYSSRLRAGRAGDLSPVGLDVRHLSGLNILLIAPLPNDFWPIVDAKGLVAGVHAGAPPGEDELWMQGIQRATKAIRRLFRNGEFINMEGAPAFMRVGLDFGVLGAHPHPVVNLRRNCDEVQSLLDSVDVQAIAAHQNHLLRRIAPRMFTHQILQIEQVTEKEDVHPAFPGAFTTAQFSFGNTYDNQPFRRDTYERFGSFHVFTFLGNYGPAETWFFYWREEEGDRIAICCPVGSTVVVPTSIVRYGFTSIQKGETRYIFEQFFNAAIGRWVDQGCMSDAEYAEQASEDEWLANEARRSQRVGGTVHLMSRVGDLFVQK